MNDQDIISTYINTLSKAKGLRLKQEWQHIKKGNIDNVPNEHIEYLINRFTEFYSNTINGKIYESIYRIAMHIEILNHCPICGKTIHYQKGHIRKTCGTKCGFKLMGLNTKGKVISGEAKLKRYKTNLEKYGSISPFGNKSILEKSKQTNLERYGVTCAMQNPEVLLKRNRTNMERYGGVSPTNSKDIRLKQINANMEKYGCSNVALNPVVKEKIKQTNISRYGSENPFGSDIIKEKIKRTNLERYGVENYQLSDEGRKRNHANNLTGIPKSKEYITKKNNGSFNTSKGEERLYAILCELYSSDDIIREYNTDSRYPFSCDFYIRSQDIFIELQGHYTHGGHPYNPDNKRDLEKVLKYQNYPYILDVWTVRDPLKRKTAKENHLNFIEIFDYNFSKETIIREISKITN